MPRAVPICVCVCVCVYVVCMLFLINVINLIQLIIIDDNMINLIITNELLIT